MLWFTFLYNFFQRNIFLDFKKEDHINPKKRFNPEISIKNTQLFRKKEYQKEISQIHDDIKKVESLENLISSEIDEDTRSKIYDGMNELNQIFNVEEGS